MNGDRLPFLILPTPVTQDRARPPGRGADVTIPSLERQRERLAPQFERLTRAFEAQRALLQQDVAGASPELVLVLEVVGSVPDFVRAVQRIEGAEWLGELEEVLEPDDDFYVDEEHPDKTVSGRLFLVMSDQRALTEIVSLWQQYSEDPGIRFRRGLAPWKSVFAHLREVRLWEARDRVEATGIAEDWRTRVASGEATLPVEVELWFRGSAERRRASADGVRQIIAEDGGQVIRESELPDIAYHALLASVSADSIDRILTQHDARLVRTDDVMFLRPAGQAAVPRPDDDPLPAPEAAPPADRPAGEPVVALLDGAPLVNHAWLDGRLTLDDPDGWSDDYPAVERDHGTAMASLICHGDLGEAGTAMPTPIYVRPILRPDSRDFRAVRVETVPDNELFVDLVHRAVIRLFDGGQPVAAGVRVVSLSVCDPSLVFDRYPSPVARLLDWLAWRFSLLFIVSAGNYPFELSFEMSSGALDALSAEELEALTIRGMADDVFRRRIIAPAESINALTVASAHRDSSPGPFPPHHRDLMGSPRLPSPLNATGLGFRRSVKPDILMPGGRQTYRDAATTTASCRCEPVRSGSPPGQRVSSPGVTEGELAATRHTRGTSNAAAFAAREAGLLHERVVVPLRDDVNLPPEMESLVVKALLVHAASWDGAAERVLSALAGTRDRRGVKEFSARLLGYGAVDEDRLLGSEPSRVSMIGWGSLGEDLAHVFEIPLPPALNGEAVWRRLTVTLAWFTPVNPLHRLYRRAQLWFEPAKELLALERAQAQWQMVRRGTVQHEVLEGERAATFADGDVLGIRVNCRAEAGELADEIPYVLGVTLEVAPALQVSIFEEIQARIRPRVAVAPAVGV